MDIKIIPVLLFAIIVVIAVRYFFYSIVYPSEEKVRCFFVGGEEYETDYNSCLNECNGFGWNCYQTASTNPQVLICNPNKLPESVWRC